MMPRHALLVALFAVTLACSPEETVRLTPSPTPPPSTPAATTPAPTRTASPAPTPTQTASPSPTPTATTAPGSSPNAACAPLSGGSQANRAVLTAIRIAHNPGFDRLVFEFGPSTGPGTYGVPPYQIEVANTFTTTSGQQVRVDGNAFIGIRFQNTDAHDQAGKVTVTSTDVKPTTPLIKEARMVEDFEAVVRWAVGLDHLVCPQMLTLAGPVRVVLDFPTPP
jgi:hypothetical protein